MNPSEVLRIVDTIHRDKNIDKQIVFQGIEAALVTAAKKRYGEDAEVAITIDRDTGVITGNHNGIAMTPEEISERIMAQTAKQVMIQKMREAERDALFDEYMELKDHLVTGIVQRYEGGAATVALSNVEAILPKGEQIPGESHHANERVRAVVSEVKKSGTRVKIVLSRTSAHLVQRLFEQEIPEITDGVIEIRAMAREPGYRTKVAVSSTDQRVDSVGACVGVRGNRIKNIVDELGGERIDIVRWSDDLQVLIPNALQPAEIEEVILCQMLGRAIVLVREDQLSLAIGRRGQNVRLASKLCGWDIEIMTRDELDEQLEQALGGFGSIEGVSADLADRLVGEGFLSYDDLSVIEPSDLAEMGGLTEEQVQQVIEQAETRAAEAEKVAAEERRRQRQEDREATAAEEPAAAATQADEPSAEVAPEAEPGAAAELPAGTELPAASELPGEAEPAALELPEEAEPAAGGEGAWHDEPAAAGPAGGEDGSSARGEDGNAAWSQQASEPSVDEETRNHDGT
jgi:N utilization substance protein A